MAEREETKPDHEERQIPVFTVLKNGAILKNIFIVNNVPPPSLSHPNSIASFRTDGFPEQENEEVTVLGRHPDCNIMLTHPSISRFHLQIHSNPSSQKLCVVDLSSVHGTWVSGKKIEPGARVEMSEGDTLRVGGSSRVYRLHWVPLSRVYDFESLPLSALGVSTAEKKEDEVAIVEEKAMKNCEKEISLLDENKETEIQENSVSGNIGHLYSDENWKVEMMRGVPSGPPLGEGEGIVVSTVDGGKSKSHSRNDCEQEETSLLSIPSGNEWKSLSVDDRRPALSSGKQELHKKNESPQPPSLPLLAENLSFNVEDIIMSSFLGGESKSPSSNKFERNETSSIWTGPLEYKSRSPSNGKQQLHSKNESSQPPSLPLSAENLSFNVENIIMSSFFDSESKSLLSNTFEREVTSSIWIIPLENDSKNLSVVDVRKPTPKNEYQQFDNENKSSQPCSTSLCKENSSNVEDIAMLAFGGGECESPSRNMFEQKEISSTMTIPLGCELSNGAVVDDGKPISDNESKRFDVDYEQPHSVLLAAKNLPVDVADVIETQNLPVHEPLLALHSETVTEKKEFIVEHELHPLEDNHSSVCTEEIIQEVGILDKGQTEVGEVYVDEGNEKLYERYQITEPLLDWQSQYRNDISMKSTSEVKSNLPMNQNVGYCFEEKYSAGFETLEPTKSVLEKDYKQKELSEPSFVPCSMEFVYSSLPDEEVSPKIAVKKESQTPHKNLDASSLIRSENVSAMEDSIWLRRGKPTSFPRIETGVSRENRVGTSLTDEMNHEIAGDETVVHTLLSHLGGEEEEEIFTPDKENFTPNTLLMKSLKKKANIEDSTYSRSSKSQSSIFKSRHKVKQEEEPSEESDKENQTPRVLQEQKLAKHMSKNRRCEKDKIVIKRGGAERAPFQSLQSNLAGNKRPEATVLNSARKSNISVCTGAMKKKLTGEGKKCWTMIVDINSLLNKESMKSLQLLQGLQGTHLIVPRIVIRELDCLRKHGSLFRKTTEASMILQWIEDCMVQTRWWIHVQSSEEGGPPATPPATPQSQYTEGSQSLFWRTASSIQSITQRSSMEALSPTTEDHILDCALHYRKVNDGQLVLLSHDVTLKIKAMAEGLICETAKEFRESLVNPFSERFLWADSSPRGLTWSCPDDVVLRERYDRCSSRLSSKGAEGAKGLKLILLHNSHYGMLR